MGDACTSQTNNSQETPSAHTEGRQSVLSCFHIVFSPKELCRSSRTLNQAVWPFSWAPNSISNPKCDACPRTGCGRFGLSQGHWPGRAVLYSQFFSPVFTCLYNLHIYSCLQRSSWSSLLVSLRWMLLCSSPVHTEIPSQRCCRTTSSISFHQQQATCQLMWLQHVRVCSSLGRELTRNLPDW